MSVNNLKISDNGLAFLKRQEGFQARAYRDGHRWAIGYGHDYFDASNMDALPSSVYISESYATTLLKDDLRPVQACINAVVTVPLNQNQFDALCSLVYNIGIGGFRHSQLLKRIKRINFPGSLSIAVWWLVWDHVDGKENPGLLQRRKDEVALFQAPVQVVCPTCGAPRPSSPATAV